MPEGALTAQDLFYVRICKFQDLFQALADIVDERITKQKQSLGVTNLICDINAIVLHLLSEIHTFREQNASIFSLPADKLDMYEYLPWTAMSGSAGMRDVLNHLVDITTRYGTRTPCDQSTKQKLYQQILELIDYILDGRKSYLDSIRDTEKYNVFLQQYESQRLSLISLLINDEQYELAAKLAEKYLDFQCLVIICDQSDSQERLDHYIKKFEEYDFSQFAINWHLRQNRQGDVFDRFKENQAALSQFMRDHPTLAWIQLIYNGDFERASKTLLQLAQNETELVTRKKAMLSLSKLASIASLESDLSTQIENINTEQKIIDYQEQLSAALLESFGFDPENQKVLKVEEIINLIITDENEKATEEDFRKALELLNYIEEPYEARHKIWCAAILRDNWIDYDINNAIDHVQNLLFFKLTEVCHLMGTELETFLPPIENFLNAEDLEEVAHNTSFQYLLKLTYECINNSFKKSDEMET
ncbi:nuclear pore complex protein Nup133-like [Teleopsis dalmanni]|uniref:nuclear pore complex protein Nup133-like n=1 Tax=Teleopsis dalmanni TaxID=139649 RepID=UPI0018CCD7E6|nr:nuclear pore complex protein Nup133-like [Teleopsis dalmanni]